MNLYKTTKNAAVSAHDLNEALTRHYHQTMFHYQHQESLKSVAGDSIRFKEGQTLKNAKRHYIGFLQNFHVNAYKQKQIKLIDFELDTDVVSCFSLYKNETVVVYKIDELHPKTYAVSDPLVSKLFGTNHSIVTTAPNKNTQLRFYTQAVALYDEVNHVKALFDYKDLNIVVQTHKVSMNAKKKKEPEYENTFYVCLEVQGYSVSFLSQNSAFIHAFVDAIKQAKNKAKALYVTFDDYAQDAYQVIYTLLSTDYITRFFMKALLNNVSPEMLTYTFYPIKERLFDTLNHLAINHIITLEAQEIRLNHPSSVFERALMEVKEEQFMKRGDAGWT